jgi:hypothetical protein
MNREAILEALRSSREKLLEAISGLSDDVITNEMVIENWTIKDLLYHISMWEAELVKLLWQASQEQPPTTVHFSNVPVDEINAAWYAQGRNRPLARVMEDLQTVHKQTLRRAGALSDSDLNDPKHHPWQKNHPLWKWIADDSYEHEEEHAAQIAAWRARLEK